MIIVGGVVLEFDRSSGQMCEAPAGNGQPISRFLFLAKGNAGDYRLDREFEFGGRQTCAPVLMDNGRLVTLFFEHIICTFELVANGLTGLGIRVASPDERVLVACEGPLGPALVLGVVEAIELCLMDLRSGKVLASVPLSDIPDQMQWIPRKNFVVLAYSRAAEVAVFEVAISND